jgi:hypothetical protein
MGWLVTDWGLDDAFGIEAMVRSYYLMQQLQQQYAFVRPGTVEYAAPDGRMLTPSQAHATGAIADSRLHVVYENGTEVFVHRGVKGIWNVKDHKGQSIDLPPSGWLVFNAASGFHEISANVGGRRIDHVSAPEYEFLDGRGQWTQSGSLGVTGSAVVRRKGDTLEIIDLYGNGRLAFAATGPGKLLAFSAEDKPLGEVILASPRAGWKEFKPVPGGRKYVYVPTS